VRTGEVLTKQTQFTQAVRRHEMGVVNDGHEHFSGAMDAEGLLVTDLIGVIKLAELGA
jgi:hypothetical protein